MPNGSIPAGFKLALFGVMVAILGLCLTLVYLVLGFAVLFLSIQLEIGANHLDLP